MSKPLITDDQTLKGAKSRFGSDIPVYDDGYGPLWIHRDSLGITAIVRAQTWHDAYEICEDEFFPACDLTDEELVAKYGFKREHVKIIIPKEGGDERPARPEDYPLLDWQFQRWETVETPDPDAWSENPLFQEAYGFRSNSRLEKDGSYSSIYSKDLNGDYLERLTPELLAELEITLTIEAFEF